MTATDAGEARGQWRVAVATEDDSSGIAVVVAQGQQLWRAWAGRDFAPYEPARLKEEWAAKTREVSRTTLVVRDAGQVLGFVSLVPEAESFEPSRTAARSAHVSNLFVLPEKHGTGIAQALDEAAVTAMLDRSFESARLWCPEGNMRARGFYERCGYVATGRMTMFAGLNRLEYRRQLHS